MFVLGIRRSPRFSPNSVDRDEAIFSAVSSRLLRKGCDVSVISEDLFVGVDVSRFDLVYSMARGGDVLSQLAQAEENGTCVVNSSKTLLRQHRADLVKSFQEANVAMPSLQVVNPAEALTDAVRSALHFPLWVKRGDFSATCSRDVVYVAAPADLSAVLEDFAARKVSSVILETHQEGTLVKFYGVRDTDFFFACRAEDTAFSKFGLESRNGSGTVAELPMEALKSLAQHAADAARLDIYGGDAIVAPEGRCVLIDFNDWPSFAPCRKAAAKAISELLCKKLHHLVKS
ncbi:MAG: hypothetical protein ACI3YC_06165 [Alloprevotella sp.]